MNHNMRIIVSLVVGVISASTPLHSASLALEYEWTSVRDGEDASLFMSYWILVVHPTDVEEAIAELDKINPPEGIRDFRELRTARAKEIGSRVRQAYAAVSKTDGAQLSLSSRSHVLLLITSFGDQGVVVSPYHLLYERGENGQWRRRLSELKGDPASTLRKAAEGWEKVLLEFEGVTTTGLPIAELVTKEDGMLTFRNLGKRSFAPKTFSVALHSVSHEDSLEFFKAPPISVDNRAPSVLYHERYALLHLRLDFLRRKAAFVIRCSWLRDSENPKLAVDGLLSERVLGKVNEAHAWKFDSGIGSRGESPATDGQ